jgi:hypothetical protein
MADAKRVFEFQVDGIDKAVEDFNTLSEAIDVLDRTVAETDKTVTDAAGSLEGFSSNLDTDKAVDNLGALDAALNKTIEDLKNSIDPLADDFEQIGEGIEKASNDAVEGLGDVEKAAEGAAGGLEEVAKTGLEAEAVLEELTATDKINAIGQLGQGFSDSIAGLQGGLKAIGIESQAFDKVVERANQLNTALQGAVSLTNSLSKENITAAKSLIGGFTGAGQAVTTFGKLSRVAIASTGIGLLVIAVGALVVNFDKIKVAASAAFDNVREKINTIFPVFGSLITSVEGFVKQVGGIRQAFQGAIAVAKTFFSTVGEAFANLIKGDFGAAKAVFSELGKESSEAFNKAVIETNEKITEERLKASLANEIKINDRIIKERQAAGRDTFNLELVNLQRQLKLAEKGGEEFLDVQSSINQLRLSRQKKGADERAAVRADEIAKTEEQAAEALVKEQELLEQAADIKERNDAAKFEREQLLREAELAALDAQEEETIAILEQAAEIKLEIARAEKQRALEDTELTNEEILLVQEEFNIAEAEIEAERVEGLTQIEEDRLAKVKDLADKAAGEDKKAKEDQLKRDADLASAQAQLQGEQDSNLRAGLAFAGEVAKEGSALQKAVFATEKSLAVADIIVKLQQELAGIAASNAALGPAALPIIAGLQIQAGIRAGLGIATVGATTFLKKGGLVRGPSHSSGGVRGSGSFNNIEVEGNEFVVNKTATARNLPLLHKINNSTFQDGGLLPDFTGINESLNPVNEFNEVLINEIRAINEAPVVVSVAEINTVQDRVGQIEETATI